jgi:cell pole-organizing protein PopZ
MAEANKGNQEPSMEEILSSIRRIIADEEAGPPEQPPRRPDETPRPAMGTDANRGAGRGGGGDEDDDDEVLELTEVVEPAREEQRPPQAERPRAELEPPPSPPRAAAAPPPPTPPHPPEPAARSTPVNPAADTQDGLISSGAASASTSALTRLTRVATVPEERPGSPLAGLTVEKLLVDMMTPMLKEWLDQNLPPLVERIVEQEVKKLARRAEML